MLCLLGAARRAHEGMDMLRTHNWVAGRRPSSWACMLRGKRLVSWAWTASARRWPSALAPSAMRYHYSNRSRRPQISKRVRSPADPDAMLPGL